MAERLIGRLCPPPSSCIDMTQTLANPGNREIMSATFGLFLLLVDAICRRYRSDRSHSFLMFFICPHPLVLTEDWLATGQSNGQLSAQSQDWGPGPSVSPATCREWGRRGAEPRPFNLLGGCVCSGAAEASEGNGSLFLVDE